MSVVEEVVAKVDEWQGKEISIEHLSGGLTNTNYKVLIDGKPFFVRVPGEGTELLAIDRNNEYHNTQAAANAGVAPKVLNYFPGYNVMILEFLDGKTMPSAAVIRTVRTLFGFTGLTGCVGGQLSRV